MAEREAKKSTDRNKAIITLKIGAGTLDAGGRQQRGKRFTVFTVNRSQKYRYRYKMAQIVKEIQYKNIFSDLSRADNS